MGRGKIEIKRIDNPTNRQVTFSKRRGGLLKKAHELAVLTDAQLGLVIFSGSGKLYEYCSPSASMREIIDRYQKATNTHFDDLDSQQQQLYCEVTRIRHESDRLQASIRQFTGEDLTGLTINDLNHLEEQLEFSVTKVRTRKHQLLHQQLDNLRRKEHILEDQNCYLSRALTEQQVAEEHKREMGLLEPFAHFLSEEDSRNMLQLGPQLQAFQLQPTQPNLQETGFLGHGLQLWSAQL
ncbi:hypothetical protein HPP92_016068 [Vanilla planifolia]|nr:hypothetical protein HPP92_016068 [Vanilla planifolia]